MGAIRTVLRMGHARPWAVAALLVCVCSGGLLRSEESTSDTDDETKTGEKPKVAPFKFSAWCAFRDSKTADAEPPKPDKDPLKNTEARSGAGQWRGFARHGKWVNLVVELQNTTEKDPITGSMRIRLDPSAESTTTGQKPYTTRYKQEYDLPPQTTKRFTFSLLCPEFFFGQIDVEIYANGTRHERSVSLTDLDGTKASIDQLIVAVSDLAGAFKFLTTQQKQNPDGIVEVQQQLRHVAVVHAQELPDRWHDLTMADLIIIDNPPAEGFNDAQIQALETYCQAGGHLLIGAGKDPALLKPAASQSRGLADLAGVNINGSGEISQIDLYAPAFKGTGAGWKLPIVDVTPKSGLEHVFVNKNSGPQGYLEKVTRRLGLGTVTLLTFPCISDEIQAWPGRQHLPLYILNNHKRQELFAAEDPTVEDDLQSTRNWGMSVPMGDGGPKRGSLMKLREEIDDSYSKDTPIEPRPATFVASFLLLYLLFAVPGNYLIFGWFKRREIAWLAVPVWSLGFSVAAYLYGGEKGQLTLNQTSIVEVGTHQSAGVARTFLGVYSPRASDYRLDFSTEKHPSSAFQAAPGHLIRKLRTRGIIDTLPELDLVDRDGTMFVENLRVQAKDTRRLEVNHRVELGDGFGARMKRFRKDGTAMYELSVQNRSQWQLLHPVVVQRGPNGMRGFSLGDVLDNGMLAPVVKQVAYGESSEWSNIDDLFAKSPPNFGKARGVDAKDRGRAMLEFVRGRLSTLGDNILLGWIDGGILPLSVSLGGAPLNSHERGMALLILPFTDDKSPIARYRSLEFSDTYAYMPTDANWIAVRGSQAVRLTVRGKSEGAGVYQIGIGEEELQDLQDKVVRVQLRLDVLVPDANQGTTPVSMPTGYKGKLTLEIEERSGQTMRWTPMAPGAVPFDVNAGKQSGLLAFEYPFMPGVTTARTVKVRVVTRNMTFTGPNQATATEWSLAVQDFHMDIVDKSKE